jgi:quercetin dioxygenase-like cupin family protein
MKRLYDDGGRTYGDAVAIRLGAIEVVFLLDDVQTAGGSTMFETRIPGGAGVPIAHSHDAFEEIFYGLAGELTFTVAGTERVLGPGDVVFVERGVVHQFENRRQAEGRFLSVATPGVLRPAYFEEIAAVFDAAAGGPPDVAALVGVMRRHGLTPAPLASAV